MPASGCTLALWIMRSVPVATIMAAPWASNALRISAMAVAQFSGVTAAP